MDHIADIQVLFSDSALLVINKPAGLSTLPDGYNPALPYIKRLLEQQFGPLWVVHRLDKGTSGVLLLARSAEAHRSLNTQFERHCVAKVYHVLVYGNPEWQDKTIELPLRPNADRQHRTIVDSVLGKPATTHLKVLGRSNQFSLVEAIPETGRTHQIRAHLYALGLAIVGDNLYGQELLEGEKAALPKNAGVSQITLGAGIGLHARSIEITHPLSAEKMRFTAPYSAHWITFMRDLRLPIPPA